MSDAVKMTLILALAGIVFYWLITKRATFSGGYKESKIFNVARGGQAYVS